VASWGKYTDCTTLHGSLGDTKSGLAGESGGWTVAVGHVVGTVFLTTRSFGKIPVKVKQVTLPIIPKALTFRVVRMVP
jgi:hypothetical protein